MSATAAGPARLGLTGLAAVAIAAGSLALAAPAASADGCAWQRHSKPVVKHLRRNGQPRRIRRIKRWWTCDPLPASFTPEALPTAPAPTPPTPAQPPEEPAPQLSHLGVKAVEYSYTLSRPELTAGEVVVELNNQGEDPHNLVLEHEGTEDPTLEIPSTPSTSQVSADFTLSPGTYRLYCSLYKHEAKGMEATLVVAPS